MSNRCLFNKSVFRSDIRRFLPFAIPLFIVDLIIFPVIIYANFNKEYPLDLDSFTGISIASDIFSYGFSGLFALLVFSYLYRANRCNAIHAFPIGRKGLFISGFLAGYILTVVPQIVAFALAVPGIYAFADGKPLQMVVLQLVSVFGGSFVFYSTAVLAVMLAGNIFAGAVLYGLISFFTPALRGVINLAVGRLGYGLMMDEIFLSRLSLSPFSDFIAAKAGFIFDAEELFFGEITDLTQASGLLKMYYPEVAVYCAASVAVLLLSYFLYKIRKLECAGDMTAFKVEIPILSLIVAFFGGAGMSMSVCIFVPFKVAGFIIAFVILSFVCFIIAQMVLRKTPKVFNLKNIILWAVFCAVTVASLYVYSAYKTNYVPDANRVKTVSVNSSYQMEISDKQDIELVEKFHEALIENAKQEKAEKEDGDDYGFLEWFAASLYSESDYTVSLRYKLSGGRTVLRNYGFDKDEKELVDMLYELEGKYHPEGVFEKLEGINYEVEDVLVDCWTWDDDEGKAAYPDVPKAKGGEVLSLCKAYSEKLLSEYRTEVIDYDEERSSEDEQASDEMYADITICCRVTDEQSRKKLNEFDEVFFDESKVRVELMTEYDDNGWRVREETESFRITVSNVPSDTELYKMVVSFDTSKKSA